MRICVSLGQIDVPLCKQILQDEEYVEMRLDLIRNSEAALELISAARAEVIATCHGDDFGNRLKSRKEIIRQAISKGASFVDIDGTEAVQEWQDIISAAKGVNCKVIVSFHDYEKTPSREHLESLIASSFASGADIAKIACMVQSDSDNAALLGLLAHAQPLIVVGMGEIGRLTRWVAPLLGSYLTYAAPEEALPTAAGQYTAQELRRLYEALGVRT